MHLQYNVFAVDCHPLQLWVARQLLLQQKPNGSSLSPKVDSQTEVVEPIWHPQSIWKEHGVKIMHLWSVMTRSMLLAAGLVPEQSICISLPVTAPGCHSSRYH